MIVLKEIPLKAPFMSQESRLKLIDLLLEFVGFTQRKDIVSHFDVGTATASRDIKLYEERFPGNAHYNNRSRRYERLSTFKCAFNHELNDSLVYLTSNKCLVSHKNPGFGGNYVWSLPHGMQPSPVATVARAIASKEVVNLEYASLTSGSGSRLYAPHVLLSNGIYWYVRGFDRKSCKYRNFRLSRISSATQTNQKALPEESLKNDMEWNTSITLTIAPHPKHKNEQALRMDLGLTDKPVLNFNVPSAAAGFVLSAMRVDCSPYADMDHNQFPYRCVNLHELERVESLLIAPGAKRE